MNASAASQSFLNEFSDLVEENHYAHPMRYSSNGLAYEITSTPVFEIYSRTGFVSTASSRRRNRGELHPRERARCRGAGFSDRQIGAPTNGEVRVVLDNANTNTLPTSIGQPAFAGFFTGGALSPVRISSQTPGAYPALDQFRVAEGVPGADDCAVGTNAIRYIRWPAPATGYVLQFSLSLSNPSWTDVQATPQPDGYFWEVTVPVQDSPSFFRLVRR